MLSGTRQDPPGNLLRPPGASARVTNVELFFDLVYVFAVTQLSHYLIDHRTVEGALQALLLLAMVWLVWVYTTWVTNWLDPERIPVRLMLLALALASLVMSAALPFAFAGRGLAVGGAYALMQIGRSGFAVAGLRGQRLQRNYQRILAWCVVSGALAVTGGLVAGHARELLWLAAVAVDVLGGLVGFYTPGSGPVADPGLDHRGQSLRRALPGVHPHRAGRVDRGDRGRAVRAVVGHRARDHRVPGRVHRQRRALVAVLPPQRGGERGDHGQLGRSRAAGPLRVSPHPPGDGGRDHRGRGRGPARAAQPRPRWADAAVSAMLLGGTALFLLGHAAFKAAVWRTVSWTRIAGVVVLAALGGLAPFVPALVLSVCAAVVVLGVAAADYLGLGSRG